MHPTPPTPAKAAAYLGLGSNLGDSRARLRQARRALAAEPQIEVISASALYRTAPVGGPAGQPDYLNAVLEVATSLSPQQLLECCLAIEADCGRTRSVRWAARSLDIDLLFYDRLILDQPQLQLPHPRLLERGFVLRPLCDLAAALVHPQTGRSLTDHLAQISPLEGVHRLDEVW